MAVGIFSRKTLGPAVARVRVAAGMSHERLERACFDTAPSCALTAQRIVVIEANEVEPTDEEFVLLQRVLGQALLGRPAEVDAADEQGVFASSSEAALQACGCDTRQEHTDSVDSSPVCGENGGRAE